MRETKAHHQALEKTVVKQREEIDKLRGKLREAGKSNQRLVIHRDSLQKDLAVFEVKQSALTSMWHDIEFEKVNKQKTTTKNTQIKGLDSCSVIIAVKESSGIM